MIHDRTEAREILNTILDDIADSDAYAARDVFEILSMIQADVRSKIINQTVYASAQARRDREMLSECPDCGAVTGDKYCTCGYEFIDSASRWE